MRLTAKGQVTIPQDVREKLNFQPGIDLEFVIVEDGVLVRASKGSRAERARRLVDRMWNRGKFDLSTEEIMRLSRGDDWNQPSPS